MDDLENGCKSGKSNNRGIAVRVEVIVRIVTVVRVDTCVRVRQL